jgi:hypothetical protein
MWSGLLAETNMKYFILGHLNILKHEPGKRTDIFPDIFHGNT